LGGNHHQIRVEELMKLTCFAIVMSLLLFSLPAAAQDCSGRNDSAPGPSLHRVLYNAQQLIDARKLQQAAKELAAYAKAHPDQDHYLLPFTRGVLAFQLKQRDQAGKLFNRATQLNPCYAPAWRNLAVVLFEQGSAALAAEYMLKAYGLSKPPDHNIKYEAAALYLAANLPARALPLLKDLAKQPKPKKTWLKALVQTYLLLKQGAKAEPVLKRLLAVEPNDATLWRLLAVVGQERNDPASAAAALSIAYGLEPPKPDGWRRLAELYIAAGAPAKAALYYERALAPKASPKDLDLLARVYIQARDGKTALKNALVAAKAAPTAKRWARVGEIHLQARRYAPAMEAFNRAAKLKGGHGRYALLAGQCALQLERYTEALKSLRQAVAMAKKGSATAKNATRSLRELERFLKSRQES
jgi:tetratricopeptide (TPR) repeat protein